MSDINDLDMWSDLEKEGNVIVPAQAAIAVFTNDRGHVVVREQGERYPDEDHWIIIDPKNVVAVVYAMLDAAGIDAEIAKRIGGGGIDGMGGTYVDIPRPNGPARDVGERPKDPTGAERQRRYREKQKAAETEDRADAGQLQLEGPDQ